MKQYFSFIFKLFQMVSWKVTEETYCQNTPNSLCDWTKLYLESIFASQNGKSSPMNESPRFLRRRVSFNHVSQTCNQLLACFKRPFNRDSISEISYVFPSLACPINLVTDGLIIKKRPLRSWQNLVKKNHTRFIGQA